MTEQRRKIIVFAALPVALVWGYYNLLVRPNQAEIPTPDTTIQPTVATAPSQPITADSMDSRFAAIKNQPWGADPFRMGSRRQAPTSSTPRVRRDDMAWQLNGIIYSENTPFAYINGRSVKVGDIVNSATVVAIDRKSVTLDVNGGRFTLSLRKGA
ncbi:MAG: hypothetical protein HY851_09170 [candidate division Zixibacteria bacterium]|nr:hypothetical protein [candidate division Zixibacteria bacterium]